MISPPVDASADGDIIQPCKSQSVTRGTQVRPQASGRIEMTTITGKRLLTKLANCPNDAYPHGISGDADGNIVLDRKLWISPDALYEVTDNVRGRDPESVNTIDSDWSVSLA